MVFAQETHRAHTKEEDAAVIGEALAGRLACYQHDCRAEDQVKGGTTRLGTEVYPHASKIMPVRSSAQEG